MYRNVRYQILLNVGLLNIKPLANEILSLPSRKYWLPPS